MYRTSIYFPVKTKRHGEETHERIQYPPEDWFFQGDPEGCEGCNSIQEVQEGWTSVDGQAGRQCPRKDWVRQGWPWQTRSGGNSIQEV